MLVDRVSLEHIIEFLRPDIDDPDVIDDILDYLQSSDYACLLNVLKMSLDDMDALLSRHVSESV